MRKPLALLLLCPLIANAAIGIGQHATGSGYASTIATSATVSPVITGSTFVVITASNQAFSTGTIGDTESNTSYVHKISDLQYNGTYRYFNEWICQNCTGGSSFQVGVTFGGGAQYAVITFIEIQSTATSSFDQLNTTTGYQTSATVPGPSVTTTSANELVLAAWASNGAATLSAPTGGFTLGDQIKDGGNSVTLGWGYLVVSSTGTYSSNVTSTVTTQNYASSAISLIASGGGGGSCTHAGWSLTETSSVPNGTSGSYWGKSGEALTPDCSTVQYWQPAVGKFGVN